MGDRRMLEHLILASYVDALDEEFGMLWVSIQGRLADSGYPKQVPLPPILDGYRRSPSDDALYALVRLRHTSRSGEPQRNVFRLIAIHRTQLSRAWSFYYNWWSSGWMSRRYYSKQMSNFLEHFKSLARSEELEKRMEDSSRAAFFKQVRNRLESQSESGT